MNRQGVYQYYKYSSTELVQVNLKAITGLEHKYLFEIFDSLHYCEGQLHINSEPKHATTTVGFHKSVPFDTVCMIPNFSAMQHCESCKDQAQT